MGCYGMVVVVGHGRLLDLFESPFLVATFAAKSTFISSSTLDVGSWVVHTFQNMRRLGMLPEMFEKLLAAWETPSWPDEPDCISTLTVPKNLHGKMDNDTGQKVNSQDVLGSGSEWLDYVRKFLSRNQPAQLNSFLPCMSYAVTPCYTKQTNGCLIWISNACTLSLSALFSHQMSQKGPEDMSGFALEASLGTCLRPVGYHDPLQ